MVLTGEEQYKVYQALRDPRYQKRKFRELVSDIYRNLRTLTPEQEKWLVREGIISSEPGREVSVLRRFDRKPDIILDENIVAANVNPTRYDRHVQELGEKVSEALEQHGILATFVDDDRRWKVEAAPFRESPRYTETAERVRKCMSKSDARVPRDASGNEAVNVRDSQREGKHFKKCIRDSLGDIATPVVETADIPPAGARDSDIRKWAEKNGVIIVSFDADAELEGKSGSDRILLSYEDLPKCYWEGVTYRDDKPGKVPCVSIESIANDLVPIIESRYREVHHLTGTPKEK